LKALNVENTLLAMSQTRPSTLLLLAAFFVIPAVWGQNIPIPYNPDENADGLIGVADLQGLLALYNTEFASAVLSDNENFAVVDMGTANYVNCVTGCAQLPGHWALVDESSAGLVVEQFAIDANVRAWVTLRGFNYGSGYGNLLNPVLKNTGEVYLSSNSSYIERGCFCVAKQRPKVEYDYCTGGAPDDASFNQCISEKLADGWYPLSGFPFDRSRQASWHETTYSSQTHASFWRWEQ